MKSQHRQSRTARPIEDAKDELEGADSVQVGHGHLRAALHVPFADLRLRQYGHREAGIFFKRLLPLLEFGREREGIDLSKVVLTHHSLKNKGKQPMLLGEGEKPKLHPLTEAGSGSVQEKEKALLAEIIEKVNDLFEGELTEEDKLVYVNNVIKGKLLESEILVQQAANNTKEQFANSPDLANGILNAIMDAFAAHSTMSKQALDSENVRSGLKDVLLGPAQLTRHCEPGETRAKCGARIRCSEAIANYLQAMRIDVLGKSLRRTITTLGSKLWFAPAAGINSYRRLPGLREGEFTIPPGLPFDWIKRAGLKSDAF